jgi:hypothetical protein
MLQVVITTRLCTPVAHLVPLVPNAIAAVAPERVSELNALVAGYTLEIIDEPRWICSANAPEKRIRISTRVIEILWAQAYAIFVFYQRMVANTESDGGVIDIVDPDVVEALELYRWALARFNLKDSAPWPSKGPRPTADPAFASDEHVADEIALIGVAYLLLHEIAHVVHGHVPNDDVAMDLEEEKEADSWAADWVLSADELSPGEMVKRSVGVAVAILLLVSGGVYTGDFGGTTHPRHFDRLYNAIAHRVSRDREEAWGVVVAVLSLHFTNAGFEIPRSREFDDFASAADALIDELANGPTPRSE